MFFLETFRYLKPENPNKKIKLDKKDVMDENQRKIQSSIDRNEFEQIFFQEFVPPKKVENFINLILKLLQIRFI